MSNLLSDLYVFLGITDEIPANFAEFFPYFFKILIAVALVLLVIRGVFWCTAQLGKGARL